MKATCFLLILFSLCIQYSAKAQFQYGLKTGLHIGYSIRKSQTLRPGDGITYDIEKIAHNWPSPLLGAYATFEISPYFSMQAELMGLHKTWRSDLDFFSRREQFEYTYLNLPFMFLLHSENFGVELGPAFNYLIIRRNISSSKTIPMEPQRTELAINAGFNYYFRQWVIGLRFTNDITPFFRNHHRNFINPVHGSANYYHRGCQASIARQL